MSDVGEMGIEFVRNGSNRNIRNVEEHCRIPTVTKLGNCIRHNHMRLCRRVATLMWRGNGDQGWRLLRTLPLARIMTSLRDSTRAWMLFRDWGIASRFISCYA